MNAKNSILPGKWDLRPGRIWANARYVLVPFKPLVLARLVKRFGEMILFKKQPLRYVDMAVDFACNLRCQHCFAEAFRRKSDKERLTIEDYKRIAQECIALGAVNFSFQGGEPLLYPQLEEIIAAFQPKKNLISVTTNATLLTPARVKQLKKLGVNIFTISLDSAIAEEHDAFRGLPGTFEKAMAGLETALAEGLRVTIGATVSHQNINSPGLRKLLEFADKRKIILVFSLAVPLGRWENNQDIILTDDDMKQIFEFSRKSIYLRTDFEANYLTWGCGAAKEILYLTPYGDVLVCPYIHISFGNVQQEPMAKIRERALRVPYLKEYWKTCLAAVDKEFIDKYLSKTFGCTDLPLPAKQVFKEFLADET